MRFTVQLPTDQVRPEGEFNSAEAITRATRAACAAGFDAVFVTDHPAPSERWLERGGHHTLDPFVALACAASASERLLLQTHVLIAGYRNPFLTAKAVASLDRLSKGRVIVGIAAGYLEAEFDALGAHFHERNELADESIALLKQIWSGEVVRHQGRHFNASGNRALPRPVQAPHPPLWIGGNAPRAIRRAVEQGDGWLPFPAPARLARHTGTARLENEGDLRAKLDYARAHSEKVGRKAPLDVCFTPFEPPDTESGALLDALARYQALGVTWTALTLPAGSLGEYLARVAEIGEKVVAPARR